MNSDDEGKQNATQNATSSGKIPKPMTGKKKGKKNNKKQHEEGENFQAKSSKVLYQHSEFSVFLHESPDNPDMPYMLQVDLPQGDPSGKKTACFPISKQALQANNKTPQTEDATQPVGVNNSSPRAREQAVPVDSAEPQKLGKRARKRERQRIRQAEAEAAVKPTSNANNTIQFTPENRVNDKGKGNKFTTASKGGAKGGKGKNISLETSFNKGKGKGGYRGLNSPAENRVHSPGGIDAGTMQGQNNWTWVNNSDDNNTNAIPQISGEDTENGNDQVDNSPTAMFIKPPSAPMKYSTRPPPIMPPAPNNNNSNNTRNPSSPNMATHAGMNNMVRAPMMKMNNNIPTMNPPTGMGGNISGMNMNMMNMPPMVPMSNSNQAGIMSHPPPPPPPPPAPPVAGGMGNSSNMDGCDDVNVIHGQYGDVVNQGKWRVQWTITRIHEKLASFPKGTRIFSPEFSCGGINKLGLVFYPSGNSNAKNGYCSLGLKAPHGMHLRYKLYTGNTERHTELRQNVTESWGFVDMCRLEDELSYINDDTLRLGVEIIDDIDKFETLGQISPAKCEWAIRNMKTKLKHYKKDVALYSDEFSAAGIDHLRLKFYPTGKKDADDGWCSLYLEAPKGSVLRCRLSVGKKSMSFDRLEKFGEDSIWGFLTLCKLKDELEEDGDMVRVGLEVLETKRLDQRLSESEDAFLRTLSSDRRAFLLSELDRMEKAKNPDGNGEIPSRFKILEMDLPDASKALALGKIDAMNSDVLSGETSKLKKWIDGLLALPFGTIRKPIVAADQGLDKVRGYLQDANKQLDAAVFGHAEPKEKILQILCQWISNPDSMSLVLGIQGPPGNGKTTLCRKGIAEALGRPFVQISLGGATDASVLEGHSYTYVGSTWGRIAGLMMDAKCMNPVIFFDELDKVSETARGEEIVGVLTHVTDHSQNKVFHDRYFEGIPIDLSKCLFVFSFNDIKKINPVLKDRLTVIHTKGFEMDDKVKIAQEYLLPELLDNVKMPQDSVVIEKEQILHLCRRRNVCTQEGGVRGLKQALEAVVLHLNKIRLTESPPVSPRGEHEAQNDSGSKAVHTEKSSKAMLIEKSPRSPKFPKAAVIEKSVGSLPETIPPTPKIRSADSGDAPKARAEEAFVWKAPKLKKGQNINDFPVKLKFPVKMTNDLIDRLVRVYDDNETFNHRAMFV